MPLFTTSAPRALSHRRSRARCSTGFRPHPLYRGGHAQTLAGFFMSGEDFTEPTVTHEVQLDDGDRLALNDTCPADWQPGDRAVLMVHGLGGCHQSGYQQRIGKRLYDAGVRVFRLDLRGSGNGTGWSTRPYNAHLSCDLLAATRHADALCGSASPLVVCGFSLGAGLTLKMGGEFADQLPESIIELIAVNPPLDLNVAVKALSGRLNRYYDRYFTRLLLGQMEQYIPRMPALGVPTDVPPPKSLFDFDNRYTAPFGGFRDAQDYYRNASAKPFVERITRPTRILMALDDPLIPATCADGLDLPEHVALQMSETGGHLGYVAWKAPDGGRRWMDWRVFDWVMSAEA